LVSNQRELTAAVGSSRRGRGSGKSWRIKGMWYLVAASLRRGLARGAVGALHVHELDDGHAGAGGGLRAEVSCTWVPGEER
jgi:hypothetical protein